MPKRKRRTQQMEPALFGPPPIPGHEQPLPKRLNGVGWGAHKRKVRASTQYRDNQRAFAAWRRLTHDGWRFNDKGCMWCGTRMTPAELVELDALRSAYPHWANP